MGVLKVWSASQSAWLRADGSGATLPDMTGVPTGAGTIWVSSVDLPLRNGILYWARVPRRVSLMRTWANGVINLVQQPDGTPILTNQTVTTAGTPILYPGQYTIPAGHWLELIWVSGSGGMGLGIDTPNQVGTPFSIGEVPGPGSSDVGRYFWCNESTSGVNVTFNFNYTSAGSHENVFNFHAPSGAPSFMGNLPTTTTPASRGPMALPGRCMVEIVGAAPGYHLATGPVTAVVT